MRPSSVMSKKGIKRLEEHTTRDATDLVRSLRHIADAHLGSPWNCDMRIWDDGSVLVKIKKNTNLNDIPHDIEQLENAPDSNVASQRLPWVDELRWKWDETYMSRTIKFQESGSSQYTIFSRDKEYINMTDVNGVLEESDSRGSIVRKNANEVDDTYNQVNENVEMTPRPPEDSINISATEVQSDSICVYFINSHKLWIDHLRPVFVPGYGDRPFPSYDVPNEDERGFVRDRIGSFDIILAELGKLHYIDSANVEDYEYQIRRLYSDFRILIRYIKPISDEFERNWSEFTQQMNLLFNRIEEACGFKL